MLLPRASPMAGTGALRQGLAAVQWVSCWIPSPPASSSVLPTVAKGISRPHKHQLLPNTQLCADTGQRPCTYRGCSLPRDLVTSRGRRWPAHPHQAQLAAPARVSLQLSFPSLPSVLLGHPSLAQG